MTFGRCSVPMCERLHKCLKQIQLDLLGMDSIWARFDSVNSLDRARARDPSKPMPTSTTHRTKTKQTNCCEQVWVAVKVERGFISDAKVFESLSAAMRTERKWRARLNPDYDEAAVVSRRLTR